MRVLPGLVLLLMSCGRPAADWDEVKRRVRSEFPGVEQVSADALKSRLETAERFKPVLLDVRTAEEYAVSHLPEAIRVEPGGDLPDHLETLDPKTPVVAYCSVGYRSSQLVERLKARGFADVKNLEGSIFEWSNKGYPVERDGKEVREVHPYDEQWGRLLDPELHAYRPGEKPQR